MVNTLQLSSWLHTRCSAFDGFRRIAGGELVNLVTKVKVYRDRNTESSILIFEDDTSQVVDIDFRGTADEVLERVFRRAEQGQATADLLSSLRTEQASPGRPRLGVVPREVTLLPRHWDWLNRQPGGASVALRKLVDEARRLNSGKDIIREAQETTYRFMSAIAGDLPGFEEALRALFASDETKFVSIIEKWPLDIREHAARISPGAFNVS